MFSLNAAVYDCFLFFNEFELLRCRMAELKDVVDYFVLVESVETFQGGNKPLYFEENRHLFTEHLDRIIYMPIRDKQREDIASPWRREQYQRGYLGKVLEYAREGDLFLLSDVDEIPKAEVLKNLLISLNEASPAFLLGQWGSNFMINRQGATWWGTVVGTYSFFRRYPFHGIRDHRFELIPEQHRILEAGWHFSSLGGLKSWAIKLESFSHAEANTEECKSRENYEREKNSRILVPIDDSFPTYVRENEERLIAEGFIERYAKEM